MPVTGQTLAGVTLPHRSGHWDVVLHAGRITRVEAAAGPACGLLALPAFHEPHTHADRAFATTPQPPSSLEDAITRTAQLRAASSAEQVRARARKLFARASEHGAVRMRTHVEHNDLETATRDRRAVREAADELGGALVVEMVAFACAEFDPALARPRALLSNALEDGADLLGAFVARSPDPRASLDGLLDLASATGACVDVHLDEHLDGGASLLEHLAEATIARGLEGRVSAGHCCALSALAPGDADRVVKKVAAAGITVIVLPALNLYLQSRVGERTPRLRGLALVHELLDAGVAVRFGSDNVRDPFYPYGDADPLETAWLASVAAQLDDHSALLAGVCGGHGAIEPGGPGDLVLVPAESLADAIARRPGGRVIARG